MSAAGGRDGSGGPRRPGVLPALQHWYEPHDAYGPYDPYGHYARHDRPHPYDQQDPYDQHHQHHEYDEENDVLRRAFMTGGPAALAVTALSLDPLAAEGPETAPEQWYGPRSGPGQAERSPAPAARTAVLPGRVGASEARAVERAVRRIRVLDDRHGGDALYAQAGRSLRSAYLLLDEGAYAPAIADRLQSGAGELAISVGWLAHDSGRADAARSYYAEALATARMGEDSALEAHAFCNTAFLARDSGRPREAVRAARAGQLAARHLSSPRLLSLLSLREAGGWAGLGDRSACERSLTLANRLFAKGPCDADPEWMTFYGEAELAGLEAQCWSALGDYDRAAERARLAISLQDPHFTRNIALFTAELAHDLVGSGSVAEAAHHGRQVLALLGDVRSSRISTMLDTTVQALHTHRGEPEVADFLAAYHARGEREVPQAQTA